MTLFDEMKIHQMEFEDFSKIKLNLKDYWGDRWKLAENIHHPMFFYEFGKTAYTIKSEGEILAYLMGLLPQTSDKAYVHLIAVKTGHHGKRYASSLYNHFIRYAKSQGYEKIKAITSPENKISIKFHQSLGMKLIGIKDKDGIPVVKNYSGHGQDKIVFEKNI